MVAMLQLQPANLDATDCLMLMEHARHASYVQRASSQSSPGYDISSTADIAAIATPLHRAYVGAVTGDQVGLNMDATAASRPTTPHALAAPNVPIAAAALPEKICA